MADYNIASVRTDRQTMEGLTRMAADFGLLNVPALLRYLVKAHDDGLLMVVSKAVKECLIGAAEERVTKQAQKTARETTHYVLWQEGYRPDPYEH